jgi:hypothetical protein
MDVSLPQNIGVKVEVRGILGDIDAHGFNKNDKVFTNDAYGKTSISIELNIKAGLGAVNLFLVE